MDVSLSVWLSTDLIWSDLILLKTKYTSINFILKYALKMYPTYFFNFLFYIGL